MKPRRDAPANTHGHPKELPNLTEKTPAQRKNSSGRSHITINMPSSVSETRTMVLRSRLRPWLVPLCLFLAFLSIAWFLEQQIHRTLERELKNSLTTLLKADVTAMKMWLESQKDISQSVSNQPAINGMLNQLLAEARNVEDTGLASIPTSSALMEELKPFAESQQLTMVFVTDPTGRVIASSLDSTRAAGLNEFLGNRVPLEYNASWEALQAGLSIVIAPHSNPLFRSEAARKIPTILIASPVRNEQQSVVGALCFAANPAGRFTQVLGVARSGKTGETYAVNASGLLLSESRFEDQLRELGLLQPDQESSLTISIRNPGGNLVTGYKTDVSPLARPLTKSAASLAQAAEDQNAEVFVETVAFRDYRGVPVIGAWQWLPEYGFGIITEVDDSEAHAAIFLLRRILRALLGLMGLSLAGVLIYSQLIAKAWQRLRRAEMKLEKLGQYELLERVGAGAMGEVYRAKHALLRRDTAVKLLRPSLADIAAISRFEREVQATSQLTSAHTVQIFDYGRTPDGLFYYAMEFLDGLNLDDLVKVDGPLGDGRTIFILKQVCLSLAEAHSADLIHRDIKPSNIVVGHRGGFGDCVKVVDFGLVRSLAESNASLTVDGAVAGTPAYMSPEASQTPVEVGPLSDLYSVGCVGYYMLTGRPPFIGNNPIDVCWKHIREPIPSLANLMTRPICPDLEQLVMRCLEKDPAARPPSILALLKELHRISPFDAWTYEDAELWWNDYRADGNGNH
jgi:eukaryotic-like serine/threonine-protein kinase